MKKIIQHLRKIKETFVALWLILRNFLVKFYYWRFSLISLVILSLLSFLVLLIPSLAEIAKYRSQEQSSFYLYAEVTKLAILCSAPTLIFAFVKLKKFRFYILMVSSLLLCAYFIPANLNQHLQELKTSNIGEEISIVGYVINLALITIMFISFSFVYLYFSRSNLMDRYLIKQFLIPFIFSLVALSVLWIIIDLQNNGPDFLENNTPISAIVNFYLVQIPWLIIEFTPITLLLGVLFSFGKMSKSNELISMISSGISYMRAILPIIIISLYMTFICLVLNYQYAPWSKGNINTVHEEITSDHENEKSGKRINYFAKDQVYYSPQQRRIWYIGKIPEDMANHHLRNVVVIQLDENDNVIREIYAERAIWREYYGVKTWFFDDGRVVNYEKNKIHDDFLRQDADFLKPKITDWRGTFSFPDKSVIAFNHNEEVWLETPWELVSSGINPEFLGVPKLTSYLKTKSGIGTENKKVTAIRTQRHFRFSLPWRCLIVVLFAAPLATVFSRRGLIGNVTTAIAMYIVMFFLSDLFVALGSSGRISAFLGAWLITIIFIGIGALMVYSKGQNKEFNFRRFLSLFTPKTSS